MVSKLISGQSLSSTEFVPHLALQICSGGPALKIMAKWKKQIQEEGCLMLEF